MRPPKPQIPYRERAERLFGKPLRKDLEDTFAKLFEIGSRAEMESQAGPLEEDEDDDGDES